MPVAWQSQFHGIPGLVALARKRFILNLLDLYCMFNVLYPNKR